MRPVARARTRRILALQGEERQARQKLGQVSAAIGAELIAVKEALDKTPDKTAWLRWLKSHVHYTDRTARNYMDVARLAKNRKTFSDFSDLEPSVLYRIAALPDAIAATLTPDTLLTDPKTGKQRPLKDMSARELDRALDALAGRPAPAKPKPAPGNVVLSGATREEFAADTLRIMGVLSEQITGIRGRKGALTGGSKQRVLAAIESLRRIVLKWPAWATPSARKRIKR